MRAVVRLAIAGATVIVLSVAAATPAGAHSADGPPPSNFHPDIVGFLPPAPGVVVGLAPDEDRIELRTVGRTTAVVLGYDGEPYLRVGPDGVYENRGSPAVALNRSRTPSGPGGRIPEGVDWVRISDGRVARWHDHRAHWMGGSTPPAVARDPDSAHTVSRWRIPVRVGDVRHEIRGRTVWEPPPPAWAWYLLAAAFVALVAALARWRRAIVVVLVGLATAEVLHLIGAWPFTTATGWAHGGEILPGLAAIAALMLATAVVARRGVEGGAPAVMIAGLFIAVAGGLSDLAALSHSWVPSRWAPTMARLLVVWSLGGGIGLLLVGATRLRRTEPAPAPD